MSADRSSFGIVPLSSSVLILSDKVGSIGVAGGEVGGVIVPAGAPGADVEAVPPEVLEAPELLLLAALVPATCVLDDVSDWLLQAASDKNSVPSVTNCATGRNKDDDLFMILTVLIAFELTQLSGNQVDDFSICTSCFVHISALKAMAGFVIAT